MEDIITCSICGMTYDSSDHGTESHNFYHKCHNDLELTSTVRDYMRICAENVIMVNRDVNFEIDVSAKELVLVAVATMMHMWYNEEYRRFVSKDIAFDHYRREMRKRYSHLRSIL